MEIFGESAYHQFVSLKQQQIQEIVSAITLFDKLINGGIDDVNISCSCSLILSHLIVEGRKINLIHSYTIHGTVFLQKKTKIKIWIHLVPKDLGLIFGGRGLEMHLDDEYIPDDDMTNILKLNLFNNLQTIRIRC